MSTKTQRVILITLGWVALSILLFAYAHFYLIVSAPESAAGVTYNPGYNLGGIVVATLIGGLAFGYTMVYRSPKQTRRRSFRYGIVFNSVLFLVMYTAVVLVVTLPIAMLAEPGTSIGPALGVAVGVLTNPASAITMLIWALIVAATQFTIQVSDKFGQGVLWHFLTGRYFQPREEERIFMFLDLASSTTIAERMGHAKYFEFIRECIADVTEPILANGGEIYQYVGDEVVVTWKTADALANSRCVACYFAIEAHLQALSSGYRANFDATPRFKAGLHAGRVTVGEIGVVRKDIVFSGDVLNTTARIQAQCNPLEASLLASSDVVALLERNDQWDFRSHGPLQLRGKEEAVELIEIRSKLTLAAKP